MSKNAETFRKDFDGKDTTTGTVKARKKDEKFFLSTFFLSISDLQRKKRKLKKNIWHGAGIVYPCL
jgi:hypothetical protein